MKIDLNAKHLTVNYKSTVPTIFNLLGLVSLLFALYGPETFYYISVGLFGVGAMLVWLIRKRPTDEN